MADKRANQRTAPAGDSATEPGRAETPALSAGSRFFVVGIGASAGGLEAATELFRHLPGNTGMAFVFICHLDPTHHSMVSEILGRVTSMPVTEAAHGVRPKPDHVYTIPPNATLTLKDGRLRLEPRARAPEIHLPVDVFFDALATELKNRAIGVVLSGSGSDGALGVRSIKAENGFTLAQDDESAAQGSMPGHAIATGYVDIVAPPAGIARELAALADYRPPIEGPTVLTGSAEPARAARSLAIEMEHAELAPIFGLLRGASDVDFRLYKAPTVVRRIARRMALAKITSVADYTRYLQSHPGEVEALSQDLLINVTHFFRDPAVFAALSQTVLRPLLEERRPIDNPLRVWVPGCSTGEEVYSIAISLIEHLGDQANDTAMQIFCTDASEAMVARARTGIYPENIAADVSPVRLRRFFTKVDSGYQVSKVLRELCIFARQNVAKDPPFSRIDLISCRNVLIYMTAPLQKRVMHAFHFALKPTGFLLLGGAESVSGFTDIFSVVNREHHIFKRKPGPARLEYPVRAPEASPPTVVGKAPAPQPLGPRDTYREVDRLLLDRYAPAGVVVTEALEIVQFRGDTSPYLAPAPGLASLHLLKMARTGLAMRLPEAIRTAQRRNGPVTRTGVRIEGDGRVEELTIEVLPVVLASGERHFLIVFRSAEAPPRSRPRVRSRGARGQDTRQARRVAAELDATKRYLQSVIEDQEATNEELKSANEEIVSSNEEMQSTNEELETAKEELQSANEELTTLNEQLQNHNQDLTVLSSDLANILGSVSIPVVLVDESLLIRRVTPGAGRLFNVLPTDLGRPLGQIRVKLDVPDLTALVQAVIETVTPRDVEVRADDGRWYSLRIRPYRTAEHRITGAVLALVDVDELRRTAAARDYARAIIETVREPLVVLDANLNVREVNAAFYRTFHVGSSETTGRLIYELGNGEWDIPALRRLLEDVLPQHVQLTDFEVDHTFPHIGRRVMRLNASRIVGPELILLAIEDVTEHHVEVRDVSAAHMNALERERLARQDAEAASRAKDTFLATLSHELRTPLTSMLAWVRMLRSGRLDEAVTTRALESIERNTRAQAELIEDLLDVSRITSGKLRLDMLPLDLAAVIQTAIETLRPAAEAKSIRLDATLAPARGAVLGDRERLQQVVWNLVSNAVKFTPRGGRVEVTLAWEDHRARLTVQDTGMGIKPTLLPSIFERFRQGEDSSTRTFGGLGIGLAIVRHIVELHGGTVTAESAGEGQGATFTVAIPFAPAAARPRDLTDLKPAVVRELHADPAMLDGIRVMLVEDDRDAREVVAAVLTHHGAVVSAVSSASEALEVLHDVRPDVLVSDIGMPGQDGYALMRAVRALPAGDGGRVAAIALTAYARADDSRQALDAGFQMHLSKPVDPGMLAFTVARLHRERTEG